MTRLFVAVWPPSGVVDALRPLVVPGEPGVRWVTPEQWHVTLRFLGDADPDEVATALRAAALPAAEAGLGPTVATARQVRGGGPGGGPGRPGRRGDRRDRATWARPRTHVASPAT